MENNQAHSNICKLEQGFANIQKALMFGAKGSFKCERGVDF